MRCAGIKSSGEACKAQALDGSTFCYNHSPEHAEQRRHNATLGGRLAGNGRPLGSRVEVAHPISSELDRLRGVFEQLAEDVLEERVDRSAAAVAIQALNGARGCIVGALKAQEQEQMAAELAELTEALEERGLMERSTR